MVVEKVAFAFPDHRLESRPGDILPPRFAEELLDEHRVEILRITLPFATRIPGRPGTGARQLLPRALRDSDVLTCAHQVPVGEDGRPSAGLRFGHFDPAAVRRPIEHVLHRRHLRPVRGE
jgi:hypothetical protein